MAAMPGQYAARRGGELLLARGEAAGCVALRPLEAAGGGGGASDADDGPRCCEMKRRYVVPSARGSGVGLALLSEDRHRRREAAGVPGDEARHAVVRGEGGGALRGHGLCRDRAVLRHPDCRDQVSLSPAVKTPNHSPLGYPITQ